MAKKIRRLQYDKMDTCYAKISRNIGELDERLSELLDGDYLMTREQMQILEKWQEINYKMNRLADEMSEQRTAFNKTV